MPTTEYSEQALARRKELFEGAAAFPGRLGGWPEAVGRTVAAAYPYSAEGTVVVFDDGTFLLTPDPRPVDRAVLEALLVSERELSVHHPAAWLELRERLREEQEAMRLARMEKVLGAVETNLPKIPELRTALRKLLESQD